MKLKQLFYITAVAGIICLSGCSGSQAAAPEDKGTNTSTPAPTATLSPAPTLVPEAASDSDVTTVPIDSDNNDDSFKNLLNRYTDQTLISLPSDNYQWDSKELTALLNAGKIVEISNGTDFNTEYDDSMKISFDFTSSPENPEEFSKYSLTVNNSTIENETSLLLNKVYLACLGYQNTYQLIIQETGYTEDSLLHIFSYDNFEGTLNLTGIIEGYLTDLHINEDHTFSSTKRARSVETWYYAQNYIISNYYFTDDYSKHMEPVIVEMPPLMYPLGTQVITKIDIPLLLGRTDSTLAGTVPAGTPLVLSACDDVEWLYVSTTDDSPYSDRITGYIRIADYTSFWINGEKVDCAAALDGLLFAD